MKIFVVGNINSGKSRYVNYLKTILPKYKILQIDEYRKEHCDGSIEKEFAVWSEFPKEVMKYKDVIVEFSGLGKMANNFISMLDDNSCIVIKIKSNKDDCLKRLSLKDFSLIPYPKFENAESIEETIIRIDNEINNLFIENIWQDKSLTILEYSGQKLPIIQYHFIFMIKDIFLSFPCQLFLFGSSARNKMNEYSDVDMFLLTSESIKKIKIILEEYFNNICLMGNELVIRDKDILIELYVISNIDEAKTFYNTSRVENVYKTILIGNEILCKKLIEFDKLSPNISNEISYTKERLMYYIESLYSLSRKGDIYKYYFHNNIVIHEAIRLKAFMAKKYDRNYLPLNGYDYFTKNEWNVLLFSFEDDMAIHYIKVKRLVESFMLK